MRRSILGRGQHQGQGQLGRWVLGELHIQQGFLSAELDDLRLTHAPVDFADTQAFPLAGFENLVQVLQPVVAELYAIHPDPVLVTEKQQVHWCAVIPRSFPLSRTAVRNKLSLAPPPSVDTL